MSLEPLSKDMAELLASERTIAAAPLGLRARSVQRAEAALGASSKVLAWPPASARLARITALLVAAATCALAALPSHWRRAQPPAARAPVTVIPNAVVASASAAPQPAVPEVEPPTVPSSAAPRRVNRTEQRQLELALLEPARSALDRKDFSGALRALDRHQRVFPHGQLSEEREAMRVLALLGSKHTNDARAAADSFAQKFPGSVLAPRLSDTVSAGQ